MWWKNETKLLVFEFSAISKCICGNKGPNFKIVQNLLISGKINKFSIFSWKFQILEKYKSGRTQLALNVLKTKAHVFSSWEGDFIEIETLLFSRTGTYARTLYMYIVPVHVPVQREVVKTKPLVTVKFPNTIVLGNFTVTVVNLVRTGPNFVNDFQFRNSIVYT